MEGKLNIEQIEKYLNNELSATERKAFDSQLQEDESLQAEFQRRQMAHRALDVLISANLKKQLEDLESESEPGTIRTMNVGWIRLLSIAAGIALLVGAFYFLSLNEKVSRSALAASYYEAPNTLRGGEVATGTAKILSRGLKAIQKKEYQTAILTLDSIASDAPFYLEAQYYKGHAYYLSGDYQQAETIFANSSTTIDLRYSEEAEWFALLSCLASEGTCEERLSTLLKNAEHTYYKQALDIQEKIRK